MIASGIVGLGATPVSVAVWEESGSRGPEMVQAATTSATPSTKTPNCSRPTRKSPLAPSSCIRAAPGLAHEQGAFRYELAILPHERLLGTRARPCDAELGPPFGGTSTGHVTPGNWATPKRSFGCGLRMTEKRQPSPCHPEPPRRISPQPGVATTVRLTASRRPRPVRARRSRSRLLPMRDPSLQLRTTKIANPASLSSLR